jgi:hypothetical protein
MAAFLFGLPILQSFVSPQFRHFGRYIFPVIPLVALGVAAFARNHQDLRETDISANERKRWRMIVTATFLIVISPATFKWIANYGFSVSNINDQHLAIASWVNTNAAKSDIIGADDVGALGYFTKRNIIDLTGLVSPAMYPLQHDQRLVWKAARDRGANLFVIYTRLNPTFYAYAKDSLELVSEFPLRKPIVSSADTVMSIFRVKGTAIASR